jgi:uncharacterized phage-like protein YoqJ
MILSGTGHRPEKLGNEWEYDGPVTKAVCDETICWLRKLRPDRVLTGGALGFDTILAICALSEGTPLEILVPFEGQESKWSRDHQSLYHWILSQPGVKKTVVCEGGYAAWKMQKRNESLVDRSDALLACYDGTGGGTGNCVAYASSKGKAIHVMNEWIRVRDR